MNHLRRYTVKTAGRSRLGILLLQAAEHYEHTTQEEQAEQIGISVTTFRSLITSGQNRWGLACASPSKQTLGQIAKYLGFTRRSLILWLDAPDAPESDDILETITPAGAL